MDRLLDVMVVTHGPNGLGMVEKMHLPQVAGVVYLVSWQIPEGQACEVPAALRRDDIQIHTTNTIGSSPNRNNALRLTKAKYCLVSDNDLAYTPEQLQAVIDTLNSHPDVDVASFMFTGDDNKQYPKEEADLTRRLPKNFYSTCFEIAFRRDSVYGKIWYDENFGVNAPLSAGEDGLFLYDCRKAGLQCRFFPIVITHHQGLSTGNRELAPSTLMAEGALMRIMYPWSAWLRMPLFAYRRNRSRQAKFWTALKYLIKGYFYKLSRKP